MPTKVVSTKENSLVLLLGLLADVDDLQDSVVGAQLQGSNVDLNVVPEKLFGQRSHLLGPRGTPHQGLAVRLQAQ